MDIEMDVYKALQKVLNCVICLNTLIDPVTIVCGHTFCRPCLYLAWEEAQNPARCRVCRAPSQKRDLKTNIKIKNLVSIARKARLRQFLSSEEHRCETHQEPKQMFCEVETKLLCKLCSRSPEHQAHQHSAIEEAAEAHREMILKQMTSLWDKIQDNQRNVCKETVVIYKWISYMHTYRRIIHSMYEMLLPQLQEEAKTHSETLINEERVTLEKLKTREMEMLNKKTQLRKMYQELMKTYQIPYVKLLMDWKYTRARCESLLVYLPQPMNPKLRALPISGLETQNPGMTLFDEVRKFTNGNDSDDNGAFLNSDGSNCSIAWGVQRFNSWKHYWELSVDDSKDWAGNQDAYLFTTSPLLTQFIERPVGRVGVFLDFEDGSLSFVNVAKGSFIWKYPPGTLQFSVRPFCSTGPTA
ncbi:tripartite motif-containing protein 43-like [Perognathus longimembris pacificus]|uniref:tripartite motif-containing protein 43-like n=1 Tax=Perognathus longimembris pacificus TaxID=214514 RepID=UPI0020188F8A|nr:tripartite motif-containing protein 43-like [Perognathus longimembris pacificus]